MIVRALVAGLACLVLAPPPDADAARCYSAVSVQVMVP